MAGEGIGTIWGVKLQDDVTANAYRMAHSVDDLTKNVRTLGDEFKASNKTMDALEIGLKEARSLFNAAGGNAKLFKAALKDAGVSALDSSLLLGKMNAELRKSRHEALGLTEVSERARKLEADADRLAEAWKRQGKAMTMGGARSLFRAAGKDTELLALTMKKAGVASEDSRMILGKLNSELDQTRRRALGLDGIWSRIFNPRTIWVASHALNVASKTMGAMRAVGGGAYGLAAGAAGTLYDYGQQGVSSVVEAATKRQNAIETLAYQYTKPGTSEVEARRQAATEFKWAQRMAKDTPLETEQITGALQQFTTAGYDQRQARILTQVMADQASKNMARPEMGQNVINAFSRMQGRGTATAEDLESLRIAGFRAGSVMDELKKIPELAPMFKGVKTSKSDEENAQAVRKVLGTGRIGTMAMTQAAISSLERDKPDIGVMAKNLGASSLAGTISNVKGAWQDLLQSVDLQNWPGVRAFQDFLQRISKALDSDTESGKNLLDTVKRATDNLLVGLRTIEQSDIDSFVSKVGDAALKLTEWLKDAWGWFDRMIHSDASFTDTMSEALLDVGFWIGKGLWQGASDITGALAGDRFSKKHAGLTLEEAQRGAAARGQSVGQFAEEWDAKRRAWEFSAGQALPGGGLGSVLATRSAKQAIGAMDMSTPFNMMTGASYGVGGDLYGKMYEVGAMGGQGLIEGARGPDGLDAHSPSRRMMEVGAMGAEGLVQGATRGMGAVGGTRNVNVTINAGGGDAAAQWEAIRPTIQREVIAMFDRASGEG